MKPQEIQFFAFIFFMIGLFTQSFAGLFKGWVSLLVVSIGIEFYILFLIWFSYELDKLEEK